MRRITVEEVQTKAKKIGAELTQGKVISVLAQASGHGDDIWSYLDSIGPEYGCGFKDGVNSGGVNRRLCDNLRYCNGYRDGRSVAAAIFGGTP